MSTSHLILDMYECALRALNVAKMSKDEEVLKFARTTFTVLVDAVNLQTPQGIQLYALYRQWEKQLEDFDNLDTIIKQVTRLRDMWKENLT